MPGFDRREALARMAAGAAGLLTLPATRVPAGSRATATRTQDLDSLAARLRITPRAGTFAFATELIRAGVDIPTLLGAIFLCGVREIRPRPHGILHSVMMVGSSFQFADAAPRRGRLALLWTSTTSALMEETASRPATGRFRRGARAAREPDGARTELVAAMEAWDVERADRALTAFLPHCDRAALFEVLWPILARCYAFIGHKIIYAMQVERVLGRIGWRYAEPALRSLVMASLVGRDTAAFDRSRDRARGFPARMGARRRTPRKAPHYCARSRRQRARGAGAGRPRRPRRPGSADGVGRAAPPLRLGGLPQRRGRTADTAGRRCSPSTPSPWSTPSACRALATSTRTRARPGLASAVWLAR